jgi:hypothetical protein
MPEKVSPYLKFGIAYCNHKKLFTIDATGKKIYDPADLWEGMLLKREYDLKNRGNNICEV